MQIIINNECQLGCNYNLIRIEQNKQYNENTKFR